MAQAAAVGMVYCSQIFLARWMGSVEFGIYEYVVALATLLSILPALGLPTMALRLIAEYRVTQQWGQLWGLVQGSWLMILGSSSFLTLGIVGLLKLWHPPDWIYFRSLLVGIWMIPLLGLTQLQIEMARSMQKVLLAYFPSQVITPILILVGVVILLQQGLPINSLSVLGLSLAALTIVLLAQALLIWEQFKIQFPRVKPVHTPRKWLVIALPLLAEGVLFIFLNQTDIVMIGALKTAQDVGIYSAAIKTAVWISFVLRAVNTVIAPVFTTLYTQKDYQGLRSLVMTVTHWMFWPSLGIALGLVIFARPILQLFGPEFTAARLPLFALIIGQLFNVGCGSVGYLMIMTGHQNQSAIILGWGALANVILNAVLIPPFGILGAAIATALSMILWNVWLHVLVVRYLNVYPSIFYAVFRPGLKNQ